MVRREDGILYFGTFTNYSESQTSSSLDYILATMRCHGVSKSVNVVVQSCGFPLGWVFVSASLTFESINELTHTRYTGTRR